MIHFGSLERAKTLDGYDLVIYFVKSYPFQIHAMTNDRNVYELYVCAVSAMTIIHLFFEVIQLNLQHHLQ